MSIKKFLQKYLIKITQNRIVSHTWYTILNGRRTRQCLKNEITGKLC